jgi:pentatricopeptide repeat protein
MGKTFVQMQASILGRSRQSGTWVTDRVKECLNLVQNDLAVLSSPDWKCLEKQATTACVVGQANYSLPADFGRSIRFGFDDGTTFYTIKQYNYDNIREALNATTDNTTPLGYAIHYQQMFLAPAPDKTYTMRLDYICVPTDLSLDADESVFPYVLMEQGAYSYLMRELGRERDYSTAYQVYEKMKNDFVAAQGNQPDLESGSTFNTDYIEGYFKGN